MKAFVNSDGVLVAWGWIESHNDDEGVEVTPDFSMVPGRARLVQGSWEPYEPNHIPASVTMRQARLALLAAGKLAAVGEAIAALPSPQKTAALIEWDYSSTVERDSNIVTLLGPALNLDAAALDALFIAAARL